MTQAVILAGQLPSPTADTFTTAASGGSLTDSTTYYYRVSATNATGETLANAEVGKATAGGGTNINTVTVKWLQVVGATGYKVYGRSTGAELLIATIGSGATLLYLDTGSVTPAGALPVANTTTGAGVANTSTVTLTAGSYGRVGLFAQSGPIPANARFSVYTTTPGGDVYLGGLSKANPTLDLRGPGAWYVRREDAGVDCGVYSDV